MDMTVRRRVKLQGGGQARGVGVLTDGTLVVGRALFPRHTVGLYDREGTLLREVSHYGNNNQHEMYNPLYITVMADDTIVVGMLKSSHVVYLSPLDLRYLQVKVVSKARGHTLSPQGEILVAVQSSRNCIQHHIRSRRPSSILEFLDQEVRECGEVQSLSMMNDQLAVVFDHALLLYQCT